MTDSCLPSGVTEPENLTARGGAPGEGSTVPVLLILFLKDWFQVRHCGPKNDKGVRQVWESWPRAGAISSGLLGTGTSGSSGRATALGPEGGGATKERRGRVESTERDKENVHPLGVGWAGEAAPGGGSRF